MKAVFALLFLAALASAASHATFKNWANAHGKVYTAAEAARRYSIFQQNMKRIDQLNAEGDALFGITQFADLTPEEFKATYLRAVPRDAPNATLKLKSSNGLPEAFDWREQEGSVVGPVKNQGTCGSCWAFSTICYLEGNYVHKQGHAYVALSEQQLVDCDHECQPEDPASCDQGCNGGWMSTGMTYAIKNGVASGKTYPYKNRDMTCTYSSDKAEAHFTGAAHVLPEADEKALQEAVYTEGPIAVAVHADPWQLYFGGIFDKSSCYTDQGHLDHGVDVVGWGRDEATNKDYWIIRNSWGSSWGEKGYIRVRMGYNMCGLADQATLIA